jgi:hypothetical protein
MQIAAGRRISQLFRLRYLRPTRRGRRSRRGLVGADRGAAQLIENTAAAVAQWRSRRLTTRGLLGRRGAAGIDNRGPLAVETCKPGERDSTFAVPRLLRNPLVELTSPPPSDFCSNTTPIKARTSMRWMTIMTLSIDGIRLRRGRGTALRPGPIHLRASLHDPPRFFYGDRDAMVHS